MGSKVTIEKCVFRRCKTGVKLRGSRGTVLEGCHFVDINEQALHLENQDVTGIEGNRFERCKNLLPVGAGKYLAQLRQNNEIIAERTD